MSKLKKDVKSNCNYVQAEEPHGMKKKQMKDVKAKERCLVKQQETTNQKESIMHVKKEDSNQERLEVNKKQSTQEVNKMKKLKRELSENSRIQEREKKNETKCFCKNICTAQKYINARI